MACCGSGEQIEQIPSQTKKKILQCICCLLFVVALQDFVHLSNGSLSPKICKVLHCLRKKNIPNLTNSTHISQRIVRLMLQTIHEPLQSCGKSANIGYLKQFATECSTN